MPPHKGHLALISFASKRCDKLIVAVCSRPGQEISAKIRYEWMKALMNQYPNVKLVRIKACLPQDKRSSYRASKPWADYCSRRFGKIDKIFSSEKYGKYMAEYMKCLFVDFDLKREKIPVSATLIRKNPFKYWQYIPEIVRPYFVKTVCIYGPESTGKTTLSKTLAKKFKTVWAPEYARLYIASHGNKFSYSDFPKFVKGQKRIEKMLKQKANKILFCDTDPITTKIYSDVYYGKVDGEVSEAAEGEHHDYYLFCDIDLPWEKDPQRDLGDKRPEMRKKFIDELDKRGLRYSVVTGMGDARVSNSSAFLYKQFRNLTTN